MKKILRSIGSVLLGFIVGTAIMLCVETLDHKIYPLPAGVDPSVPGALSAAMKSAPIGVLLMVLGGWILGTLVGAWVTARIAPPSKLQHGMILGIFFLGAGIANMRSIPPPLWFWICGLVLFLPSAYVGSKLAVRQ
jgi:hypothetical protein